MLSGAQLGPIGREFTFLDVTSQWFDFQTMLARKVCENRIGFHIPFNLHSSSTIQRKGVTQRLIYTLVEPILFTLDMHHMQFVKIFSRENYDDLAGRVIHSFIHQVLLSARDCDKLSWGHISSLKRNDCHKEEL